MVMNSHPDLRTLVNRNPATHSVTCFEPNPISDSKPDLDTNNLPVVQDPVPTALNTP